MLHSFIQQVGVFGSLEVILVNALWVELLSVLVLDHPDFAPGIRAKVK